MKKFAVISLICIAGLGFGQTKKSLNDLELFLIQGQMDSVICNAEKIIFQDSTNAYVYYLLGEAYQSKYKYFKAHDAYQNAYKLDSTKRVFQNSLAEIYEIIGKDEEAIEIYFSQYLKDTLDNSSIINLANIFRKNKEFGSAIHYYQKAIAIDQDNFFCIKMIAYCFDQINMSTPAILYYTRAIQINPYDLNVYTILANILNSERMFVNAITICDEGLKIDSMNVQLKRIRAYSCYLNHEFELAISGFNELLSHNDSLFFNLKYRGLAYYEDKDFPNAMKDLKAAYEMEKNDAELTFYLGSALGRSNDYNEGIRFLNMSIALLSPPAKDMANIYSEFAAIELLRENYSKSLDYLKQAYQNKADPLYSFRMAQLYDQYLNDKKLAVTYYDGYLTMMKERRSETGEEVLVDSTQNVYKEYALQRIKILTEELFFEKK